MYVVCLLFYAIGGGCLFLYSFYRSRLADRLIIYCLRLGERDDLFILFQVFFYILF